MTRPARTAPLATAGIAALALARPARAQAPRSVTLAEALQLALRGQPAMVQARQNVRVADAGERQALGAFLPSLNFSSSSTYSPRRIDATTGGTRQVPSPYNSSFGFNASWDVFTGFRRGAQRSQAIATGDQREAALLGQQFSTVLATKQAFFTALANAELVGVQQTSLRLADEQLKLTSERLRLGATTRSDSLRATVNYGNAQLALIQSQNNLLVAQANLGRAIQIEGLVTPVSDSTLFALRGDLDTAAIREEARANAPTIRQADASVAAARAGKTSARSSYMPTLSLSSNYSWAATADKPWAGQYGSSWNLRASVSYPIFNNFSRETSYVTADANLQSAIAAQRDAVLALDASLTQQLSALATASRQIDVLRVSVAAAQEDLRMQTERYRLGAATIIDVLTSQTSLDQAQVNLVQARYNYLTARAQIEALVGHDL